LSPLSPLSAGANARSAVPGRPGAVPAHSVVASSPMPKLTKKVDRGSRDWYQLQCWRKTRRHQLMVQPLCEQCRREGRITVATEVDHVRPHGGDWVEFRTGALQSLCRDCHQVKTQRERGYRPRPWYGFDGSPIGCPPLLMDDEVDAIADFEDEDLD
jgi:5-methylcytosine-specific restriction endonuclease McrA